MYLITSLDVGLCFLVLIETYVIDLLEVFFEFQNLCDLCQVRSYWKQNYFFFYFRKSKVCAITWRHKRERENKMGIWKFLFEDIWGWRDVLTYFYLLYIIEFVFIFIHCIRHYDLWFYSWLCKELILFGEMHVFIMSPLVLETIEITWWDFCVSCGWGETNWWVGQILIWKIKWCKNLMSCSTIFK